MNSARRPQFDLGASIRRQFSAILTSVVALAVIAGSVPGLPGQPSQSRTTKEPTAWWAFQPLRNSKPPGPAKPRGAWVWCRNKVDRFILEKLLSKGLKPSPEASRQVLVRRLSFDLTGLPPTPDEVRAFERDRSPRAYERLVERLLASPRYGERWGRHWLDVVHYADTHGYDKDKRRDHAWPYRDYVIRSLNADMPFGRFVKEQIAGDALFPDDPQATVATGFVAAGPWDFVGHAELVEGTVEKEKTRTIDRDDMVANVAASFFSLTVPCARCHDHKFDPIPQRDYYALQAVFAGVDRGDRPYGPRETLQERAKLEARRSEVVRLRSEADRKFAALTSRELERIGARLAAAKAQFEQLSAGAPSPTNGYHSAIEPDSLAEKWVEIDLGRDVAEAVIRLFPARPTDFPDTPGFGFPPRYRVKVRGSNEAKWAILADESSSDRPNPGDAPVSFRPFVRPIRHIRVEAVRLWKRTNDFVFALAEIETIAGGQNVALGAKVAAKDSIEAGRWSAAALTDGYSSRGPLAAGSTEERRHREKLAAETEALQREWEQERTRLVPEELALQHKQLATEIAELDARLRALPVLNRVYALVPREPRPIRVLARGDVESPGEIASPGAIQAVRTLAASFGDLRNQPESARRAALALWITNLSNPLLWRSVVNRVWHYHFGKGIVNTPNDFGRMGGRPSHPELLDWLAGEFLRRGQSLKALHRLIVTSATYRQSSAPNPKAAQIDSENRLLWRMNRQRLDAESVRDAVLAVSGNLDTTMGGPGFDLFRFKDDHSPVYDHTEASRLDDPATWRRTVYRFVVRSVANPFLECLDCADPNISTPVRNTTLTALQALAFLNDAFIVKQATRFADSLGSSGELGDRIGEAFWRAFGRAPKAEESRALQTYARRHGLAAACRVLFNMSEFVFVD